MSFSVFVLLYAFRVSSESHKQIDSETTEEMRPTAFVEQTQGQRQTGRNDLPGKGEKVAKWMVRVESKKC